MSTSTKVTDNIATQYADILQRNTAIDFGRALSPICLLGGCDKEPPVPGAKAVYWLGERGWEHKGWLMPSFR